MKSGFKISGKKGFHITFDSGNTGELNDLFNDLFMDRMQSGQMVEVVWAKIYFKSGAIQMWNLALSDGIEFAGRE
ncbi:hypothetical protein LCGC14_0601780 [marine sediment metagenome]|uniref:Uncharacterized protein n=1 Tax=marine sediment metagenome TaxID=412755 RepID=A0A0F9TWD3_9ZZZZ|nr:hypothetical protein [Pricia sp.]